MRQGTFSLTMKVDGTSVIMDSVKLLTHLRFTFSVEVHNGEDNGSHVIAWVGDAIPTTGTAEADGIYGLGTLPA